jgi:heme exporter protein B
MQVFLIIFIQELKLNFRNFHKIIAGFLFFLIFFAIFSFLTQGLENKEQIADIFIYFSLLSVLIFSSVNFLKEDFLDGSLEQLLIAVENFEIVILAKIIAAWFCNCALILLAIFLIKFDIKFLLILFLSSLAINFICCFASCLALSGNNSALIAIVVLPLIIPILLIAQGDFVFSVKILAAISLFCALFSSFFAAKIIKIIL